MNERIEPAFRDPQLPAADSDAAPARLAEEGDIFVMPQDSVLEDEEPAPEDAHATIPERLALSSTTAQTSGQAYGVLHFHNSAIALRKTMWGWITHHERSLSALGMVGGFGFDDYTFRRIDLPNTQALFLGYLVVSAASIAMLHYFETRARAGKPMPKWHSLLPIATQFALGGLWSAFLVFYSRGAVLAASWPFLIALVAILIGNEVLKKYHSQLVFTSILFFFALCSYCIVTLPILTRTIGTLTFVASGVLALFVFALFVRLIKRVGREQWQSARWQIAAGALGVFAVLNAFYFTGILPPLPLALSDGGVYHFVAKDRNIYSAKTEEQSWTTKLGFAPVMHVADGDPLYVYSAVFAPIRLSTTITHLWQHYDVRRKEWVTVSKVTFPIRGGRDRGYRGYTLHRDIAPGDWRVDIDLPDGHIIGRIRFTVDWAPQRVPVTLRTLD